MRSRGRVMHTHTPLPHTPSHTPHTTPHACMSRQTSRAQRYVFESALGGEAVPPEVAKRYKQLQDVAGVGGVRLTICCPM